MPLLCPETPEPRYFPAVDPKTLNALVHDREAAFYDDRFLIDFDARIAAEVRRDLRTLLGYEPDARRALDVATGTGYLAIGLAAAGIADEVHACDLSPAMLARTRANAVATNTAITTAACDAEQLPYPDDSFDLVVARGALHHVPDPLASLKEIRRVLEPGGIAIVQAEPTPSGEKQVGAVVGIAWRAIEAVRRLRGHTPDVIEQERRSWELASIAANLHTFDPTEVAILAEKAGFEDITVGTASWAWIITLGINYFLVGEFELLGRNQFVRRGARAIADTAAAFDRLVADRILPQRWRHTIQAVLR